MNAQAQALTAHLNNFADNPSEPYYGHACPVCLAYGWAGVPPEQAAAREPRAYRERRRLADIHMNTGSAAPDEPREMCWDCRRAVVALSETRYPLLRAGCPECDEGEEWVEVGRGPSPLHLSRDKTREIQPGEDPGPCPLCG